MRFSEAILTCVEELECGPSSVRIRGWIVHPTTPIERVSVYLGNHAIAKDLPLIDRPDIRQQFEPYPFRKNALRSGFEFRAEVESPPPNARDVLLKILPSSASGPLGTV